jgi:hypothetical protein
VGDSQIDSQELGTGCLDPSYADTEIQRGETLEVLPPEGDGRNLALAGTNCHIGEMVGAKGLVGLRPSPADPCCACPFSAALRRTFSVQIHSLGNVYPAKFLFRLMTISLQWRNGRGERIGWASPKSCGPMLRMSLLRFAPSNLYGSNPFAWKRLPCEISFSVDDHFPPMEKWSGRKDSNLRPPGPKPGALPG